MSEPASSENVARVTVDPRLLESDDMVLLGDIDPDYHQPTSVSLSVEEQISKEQVSIAPQQQPMPPKKRKPKKRRQNSTHRRHKRASPSEDRISPTYVEDQNRMEVDIAAWMNSEGSDTAFAAGPVDDFARSPHSSQEETVDKEGAPKKSPRTSRYTLDSYDISYDMSESDNEMMNEPNPTQLASRRSLEETPFSNVMLDVSTTGALASMKSLRLSIAEPFALPIPPARRTRLTPQQRSFERTRHVRYATSTHNDAVPEEILRKSSYRPSQVKLPAMKNTVKSTMLTFPGRQLKKSKRTLEGKYTSRRRFMQKLPVHMQKSPFTARLAQQRNGAATARLYSNVRRGYSEIRKIGAPVSELTPKRGPYTRVKQSLLVPSQPYSARTSNASYTKRRRRSKENVAPSRGGYQKPWYVNFTPADNMHRAKVGNSFQVRGIVVT